MRHAAKSTEIAELAVRYRDRGVAGFDIAGAEAGFPPTRHLDAFEYLRRENAHFTIHAGEAFGLPSIWEAIQWCGADRLGHGVRIVDDLIVRGKPFGATSRRRSPPTPTRSCLGRLAAYVRDTRIPLEMCPSSNVQTGAADSVALHPISLLKRLRFRVTVNTDNRLMSGTSMSREMGLLVDEAGWSMDDLRWVTINAMKSAFIPFDERLAIIDERRQAGLRRAGRQRAEVPAQRSGSGGSSWSRRASWRASRSASRRRRSAMTAASTYSAWMPGGGGGDTKGSTDRSSSWPELVPRGGSQCCRAAEELTDRDGQTRWQRAQVGLHRPRGERRRHLRRRQQSQGDALGDDVRPGSHVSEALGPRAEDRGDQGTRPEQQVDLDPADERAGQRVTCGDRAAVVANHPQPERELARACDRG